MQEQLILSQIKQLPDSLKSQIVDYIEFLTAKYQNNSLKIDSEKAPKRASQFGNAKGEVTMSNDFEETLEDFSEYM